MKHFARPLRFLVLALEIFRAAFLFATAPCSTSPISVADTIEVYLFETLCAGQEIMGFNLQRDTTLQLFCPDINGRVDTIKTIEVDVLPLPVFEINGDSVLCQGEQGVLEVTGFFAGYQWSTGETGSSIQLEMPGQYSVNVVSNTGCQAQRSVQVVTSVPDIILNAQGPSCPDILDGTISISQFFGGVAPYEAAFEDGPFQPDTTFAGLAPGPYHLRWRDAGGCTDSTTISLDEPASFSLELGPDTTLYPGDTLQLSADVFGQVRSWSWSPGRLFNCDTCASPIVVRPETTIVYLLVENAEGCTAIDSLQLFVREGFQLFVPNAFAPYSGNANTTLQVFPGPGNWQLTSFEVYNRWGGPRFQSKEPIQHPAFLEWDGTVNGELTPPGLYLWVAELSLPDGRKQIRSGNVSVLR